MKVVGANPSTILWMDNFIHLCFVKIVKFVRKDESNGKEAGEGPFKKESQTLLYLHLLSCVQGPQLNPLAV